MAKLGLDPQEWQKAAEDDLALTIAARAVSAEMDARLPEIVWHMDDFEEACDAAYTNRINNNF